MDLKNDKPKELVHKRSTRLAKLIRFHMRFSEIFKKAFDNFLLNFKKYFKNLLLDKDIQNNFKQLLKEMDKNIIDEFTKPSIKIMFILLIRESNTKLIKEGANFYSNWFKIYDDEFLNQIRDFSEDKLQLSELSDLLQKNKKNLKEILKFCIKKEYKGLSVFLMKSISYNLNIFDHDFYSEIVEKKMWGFLDNLLKYVNYLNGSKEIYENTCTDIINNIVNKLSSGSSSELLQIFYSFIQSNLESLSIVFFM